MAIKKISNDKYGVVEYIMTLESDLDKIPTEGIEINSKAILVHPNIGVKKYVLGSDGKWGDFIEASNGGGGGGNDIYGYLEESAEDLARFYTISYYDTLEQAFDDINNGVVGDHASSDQGNAKAYVHSNIYTHYVTLLSDCVLSKKIEVSKNVIIAFDGHKVEISTDDATKNATAFHILNGECTMENGKLTTTSHGIGVKGSPNPSIILEGGTKLNLHGMDMLSIDEHKGATSCIYMNEASELEGSCNIITAESKGGESNDGIYGYGSVYMYDSVIRGISDHLANAAGNDYGVTSRGLNMLSNNASIRLERCRISGTHSGMVVKGNLTIIESICESYSHGGIYISAPNKNVFLIDSTFRQCDMPKGYVADNIAGTNNAGIYIGGASNVTFYVDNCNFYGKQQPIVLRGSSGESNNMMYISNSRLNLDYQSYGVRNDGSNQITFGVGNNFNEKNIRYNRNYTITEDNYRDVINSSI